MKKNILFQAIMLSAAVVMNTSCKKNDDSSSTNPASKQISYMVNENDSTVLTYNIDGSIAKQLAYYKTNKIYLPDYEGIFKYANGRLTAQYNYYYEGSTKVLDGIDTIVYDSKNLPVKMITLSSNREPKDTITITYNTNNLPVKSAWSSNASNEFTYSVEGNVATITKIDGAQSVFTYSYDNKVNPFKGNNLKFGDPEYFYSTNNITKRTLGSESKMFAYEYDADGYPTKITTTWTTSANLSVLRVFYK